MAKIEKVVSVTEYQVTLSQDEAQMIADILHRIGGYDTGRRGIAKGLGRALRDAGVHGVDRDDITGDIYFADDQGLFPVWVKKNG